MVGPGNLAGTSRAAGVLAAALLAVALALTVAAPPAAAQAPDTTRWSPDSWCRLLATWSPPATAGSLLAAACGPREGETVAVTGRLEDPEVTYYAYGTHLITDAVFGTEYALESDTVDLDRHVGRQVTVVGTVVREAGEVEGGPALIDVERASPVIDIPGG